MPGMEELEIRRGGAEDAPALLSLFDDAVAWMVARGQTGQWGSEPFSAQPARVEKVRGWAGGGGLWFAVAQGSGVPAGRDGGGAPAAVCSAGDEVVGAIVLGEAHDYVPAADRPELYVQVLLTAAAWRGRCVGARLVEHARAVARDGGAERLRVDCWAGVPELPAQYERLGFTRSGSFKVGDWPGAILAMVLDSGA